MNMKPLQWFLGACLLAALIWLGLGLFQRPRQEASQEQPSAISSEQVPAPETIQPEQTPAELVAPGRGPAEGIGY